eukprot:1159853-Pelagomonas_calceolata.AAC.8
MIPVISCIYTGMLAACELTTDRQIKPGMTAWLWHRCAILLGKLSTHAPEYPLIKPICFAYRLSGYRSQKLAEVAGRTAV